MESTKKKKITPRFILKRNENICSHKNLYMNVDSSIILKSPKVENKWLLTNEWTNKMWCMHTMECYSGIKRNKALIHATSWRNFE